MYGGRREGPRIATIIAGETWKLVWVVTGDLACIGSTCGVTKWKRSGVSVTPLIAWLRGNHWVLPGARFLLCEVASTKWEVCS